jgi:DnaJ-class molecular chaperone
MIYHPDRVVNETDKTKAQEATGKFQDINTALQVLSDPEARKYYDEEGLIPRIDAGRNQAKRNES